MRAEVQQTTRAYPSIVTAGPAAVDSTREHMNTQQSMTNTNSNTHKHTHHIIPPSVAAAAWVNQPGHPSCLPVRAGS